MRKAKPALSGCLHGADRDRVVEREDGGRRFGKVEQARGRLRAGPNLEVRVDLQRPLEGDARSVERRAVAAAASFGRHLDARRLDGDKELAVLEVLLAADGAPVAAADLLRRAWDRYASVHSNVVKVTILRLRRKLGEPPAIETVPYVGYRICE
jgi:hypothetical protein